MKKKLFLFLWSVTPYLVSGQARIVINNDAYVVIDSGAYLVLDNANTNALSTSGSGGNIISEGEYDRVKWNIGNATGIYQIPFTTTPTIQGGNGTKIPLTYEITAGGDNSGSVLFSTYETATDMNTAYPSEVTNMNSAPAGGDGSLYAVDRFWILNADAFSTRPDVTVSFGYDDATNEIAETNTITEANLVAQYFNTTTNTWEGLEGSANTASNVVSPVNVAGSWYYNTWVLVDNSTPLPIHVIDIEAVRENQEDVFIEWNLKGFDNCKSITVERKLHDEQEFSAVANLSCGATMLVDFNNTTHTSYYRLKIVDAEEVSYSEIKMVEGIKDRILFNVFPNPVTDQLYFAIQGINITSIRIIDLTGRVVDHHVNINTKQYVMSVSTYQKGLYFYELRNNDEIVGIGEFIKK